MSTDLDFNYGHAEVDPQSLSPSPLQEPGNLTSSPDLSLLSMAPLSHTLLELTGEDGSPLTLGDGSLSVLFSPEIDRDQERVLSYPLDLESLASNISPNFLVNTPLPTVESPRQKIHEPPSPLGSSVHSSPENRCFIMPLSERSTYLATPSRYVENTSNRYPFPSYPENSMVTPSGANGPVSVSNYSDITPALHNSLQLVNHLPSDSILSIAEPESQACGIEKEGSVKGSDEAITVSDYLYPPSAVGRSKHSSQIQWSDSPQTTGDEFFPSFPFPRKHCSRRAIESGSEARNSIASGKKIASEAALAASAKRRRKDAKHQCPICPQRLTSKDNLMSELISYHMWWIC